MMEVSQAEFVWIYFKMFFFCFSKYVDKAYEKLTTAVFGGIGIIRVPFREVHGMDACKDITRKSDGKKGCPLVPNELYTYSNSFPILKSYPAVSYFHSILYINKSLLC
jgi:hypothetical protein